VKVSVIFPALNEVESIEQVLREIPPGVADEILVVDGHSTDGTPELVRRLGFRVIEQEGTGYGRALATALELARQVADNAPLSVRVGKEIIDAAPTWPADEAFTRQSEMASPVILSDDAREGVAAFAEKRPPRWTGR